MKAIPGHQNNPLFYRAGIARPDFEIPGSATVHSCFLLLLIMYKSVIPSLFDSALCSAEFNLSKSFCKTTFILYI